MIAIAIVMCRDCHREFLIYDVPSRVYHLANGHFICRLCYNADEVQRKTRD